MTRGERIIGRFNPSQSDYVSAVKGKFSELIDLIDNGTKVIESDGMSEQTKGDIERLRAITFTKLEEAAMFAVKAKMHFK